MADREYQTQVHPIPPVFDANSRILILGSFPSVKSRENAFFYGHPQNRFWKLMAAAFEQPLPESIEEKKQLLLRNRVALWDVIAQCDVVGSSDASIKNAKPNDLSVILGACRIETVITNGATAGKLYKKLCLPITGREAIVLPSTSPANAAFSLQKLLEAWKPFLVI